MEIETGKEERTGFMLLIEIEHFASHAQTIPAHPLLHLSFRSHHLCGPPLAIRARSLRILSANARASSICASVGCGSGAGVEAGFVGSGPEALPKEAEDVLSAPERIWVYCIQVEGNSLGVEGTRAMGRSRRDGRGRSLEVRVRGAVRRQEDAFRGAEAADDPDRLLDRQDAFGPVGGGVDDFEAPHVRRLEGGRRVVERRRG